MSSIAAGKATVMEAANPEIPKLKKLPSTADSTITDVANIMPE
jgi:hypothetical protein